MEVKPWHTPEATAKRIQSLRDSWKHRSNFLGEKKFSYLYNCWRSIRHTSKGLKIGSSESWKDYKNFYEDMISSYEVGMRLNRIDKKKPFEKENCMWVTESEAALLKGSGIILQYNGMNKTLREWSIYANVPYNGLRQRYHRSKNYTVKEIIYGKAHVYKRPIKDINELSAQMQRNKISKMIASYKCTDKRKGLQTDITKDWVLENIIRKVCSYCGSDKNVGCDRIDNKVGHLMSNIIPCCRDCNAIRGNLFTVDEMKLIGKTLKVIYAKRISQS